MNHDSDSSPQSSRPLRETVKNLVRDQILVAAEEAFASQGIQLAKMEEIASLAGVAVGTVYNYFGDRQALLLAVLEVKREELAADLKALERGSRGQPFRVRVEAFLGGLLSHFEAKRRFYSLFVQVECSPVKLLTANPDGPFGEVYRQAGRLMRDGLAKGELRPESPEFLAQVLVGMARGTALRALADPKSPAISGSLPRLLTFFLDGASVR